MKYTIVCLVLGLFVIACNKHNNNPTNPNPSDSARTYNIGLSYPDSNLVKATDWELIITEPAGKKLLDTIVPVNTTIRASIHTSGSLVNITSVYQRSIDTAATVTTITGVDPTSIPTAYVNAFVAPTYLGANIIRNIYWKNVPNFQMTDPLHWSDDILLSPNQVNLGLLYQSRRVNNYIYTYWPSHGLYHFHPWQAGISADTVDLTHMDTAQQLNLTTHAGYGKPYCTLNGIMDTTDFTKSILLFYPWGTPLADLEYPTKFVQKYELRASYTNTSDSTQVTVYSYGSTLTADHPFFDGSAFTILSRQLDSFAIKILKPEVGLSYCETNWTAPKINYTIYSSPDSTVRHPFSLLSAAKSKKLSGLALTGLTPSNLYLLSVPGLKYADYIKWVCDPAQLKVKRAATAVHLWKRL